MPIHELSIIQQPERFKFLKQIEKTFSLMESPAVRDSRFADPEILGTTTLYNTPSLVYFNFISVYNPWWFYVGVKLYI